MNQSQMHGSVSYRKRTHLRIHMSAPRRPARPGPPSKATAGLPSVTVDSFCGFLLQGAPIGAGTTHVRVSRRPTGLRAVAAPSPPSVLHWGTDRFCLVLRVGVRAASGAGRLGRGCGDDSRPFVPTYPAVRWRPADEKPGCASLCSSAFSDITLVVPRGPRWVIYTIQTGNATKQDSFIRGASQHLPAHHGAPALRVDYWLTGYSQVSPPRRFPRASADSTPPAV